MQNIKITADSTCDLAPEQLAAHDITLMPLIVNLGDQTELDHPGIAEQIYDHFNRTKTTPKTAARSAAEYQTFFQEQLANHDALIHFSLSSGISATHMNAAAAARDCPNVYVIDSRSLSTGTAISILRAVALRDQGLTADQIVTQIQAQIDQVQCSFIVKDLTYLHRGGRCSGTAKLLATALGLKPQIIMREGKMLSGKKFMGNFASCVKKYVTTTLATYNHPDLSICFITHTKMDDPQIVADIRAQIAATYPFAAIVETIAGGTITAHCGPNTIGILYGLQ